MGPKTLILNNNDYGPKWLLLDPLKVPIFKNWVTNKVMARFQVAAFYYYVYVLLYVVIVFMLM